MLGPGGFTLSIKPARASIGLEPGQPANATAVLDAQARLLNALEEEGHAFATVDTPIAYEVPEDGRA